jgi:hypothetical protein
VRRTVLAVALTLALLALAVAGIQVVKEAKANFASPPANTVMTIENPQNTTYNVKTITLNFTVETNLGLLYFYSLDGQERKPIENITVVSQELLPDWANWWDGKTPIYRKVLRGTCVLPSLSDGWHTLTVYQIWPLTPEAPQDGNVVYSANAKFSIGNTTEIPELPSLAIILPLIVATLVGGLVYKRKTSTS